MTGQNDANSIIKHAGLTTGGREPHNSRAQCLTTGGRRLTTGGHPLSQLEGVASQLKGAASQLKGDELAYSFLLSQLEGEENAQNIAF